MKDRFIGCLLGLAAGDALGSRLEGYPTEAVRRPDLDRDAFLDELWSWGRGRWTDDTKMAVGLAESIIEHAGFDGAAAARAYLAWYESGDWRGIGRTTRLSLERLKEGKGWRRSGIEEDWAAGNGTAMRVAPLGLLNFKRLDRLKDDARDDAIITHKNHEAINGSFAVAYAVARLAKGDIGLDRLIPDTIDFLEPCDVLLRLEIAQKLLEQGMSPDDALVDLGTGGYVVETVASSFYAFLSAPESFEDAVYHAIRGGRDTDTTAAITGALSGAHLGVEAIPLKWRTEIENAAHIEYLASELYALAAK